ncbi:GrpB family protein [Alkalibacillus aidingensis]|uniref:GrpB family protein n=1 Tax=Alkalibacillus aidingensis TaxID=2747607 RepID=UPI0016611725|nr:GrpB family protein [Alkalibacillus aidingensis]
MLGVNKGTVLLKPHHEDYHLMFEKEKVLLEELFGDHVVAIEHIGSTSIKGIQAKPIIDILIGVRDLEAFKRIEKVNMSKNDYYFLQVKIEGKAVIAKFSSLENLTKTHILHVVEYDGDWWHAHTVFRNRLNADPSLAKEYEQLKIDLAEKYHDNERAYMDGKQAFVNRIVNGKV